MLTNGPQYVKPAINGEFKSTILPWLACVAAVQFFLNDQRKPGMEAFQDYGRALRALRNQLESLGSPQTDVVALVESMALLVMTAVSPNVTRTILMNEPN